MIRLVRFSLIASLLCAPVIAAAQSAIPTPPPQNISYRLIKVGDLDGDLTRDIVQLESKGNVRGFKLQYINFVQGATLGVLHRIDVKSFKFNQPAAYPCNDFDGDGLADVAVVSRKKKLGGADSITIFSGIRGTVIKKMALKDKGLTLLSLASISDINGDGVPDFVAGTVKDRPEVRALLLLSGLNGKVLKKLSTKVDETFAQDITKMGDLNGDGIPEILVGGASKGTSRYGAFSLHSGRDLSRITQSFGSAPLYLGDDVHSAPDFDQDGIRDFVVSDLDRKQGSGRHRFRVYSTASQRLLYVISIDGTFVRLNSRVIDFVSDLDQDCVAEIVVIGDNGAMRIFSGKTGKAINFVSLGNAASYATLSTPAKPYSYKVALSDGRNPSMRVIDLQALLAARMIFVEDCEPPLPWY